MVEIFAVENGLKGDPRLRAISNAIRVVTFGFSVKKQQWWSVNDDGPVGA